MGISKFPIVFRVVEKDLDKHYIPTTLDVLIFRVPLVEEFSKANIAIGETKRPNYFVYGSCLSLF